MKKVRGADKPLSDSGDSCGEEEPASDASTVVSTADVEVIVKFHLDLQKKHFSSSKLIEHLN